MSPRQTNTPTQGWNGEQREAATGRGVHDRDRSIERIEQQLPSRASERNAQPGYSIIASSL